MNFIFHVIRGFFQGVVLGAIIFLMFIAAMGVGLYELLTGKGRGDYERMKT